jgi:site-specific recombinase XerD
MPIHQHLNEMRRRNRRPGTIYQRRRALVRLAEYLKPRSILEATPEDLVAWVFDVRNLAPESQATEVTQFREFFRWAVEVELIEVDPSARLRRPSVPGRLPRPMATADMEVAIRDAPIRIKPWLLLAAYSGLRCSEIAGLRADDLWWRHTPPLVLIRQSKGGSMSSVPMSAWLAAQLRLCDLPTDGWLFRRGDGLPGPVKGWTVSQLGNRYLHRIGITATMHSLRHWFGTETLRASGGNVRVAQEALRHKSIMSTQLYTFVMPTDVHLAMEGLPRPRAM